MHRTLTKILARATTLAGLDSFVAVGVPALRTIVRETAGVRADSFDEYARKQSGSQRPRNSRNGYYASSIRDIRDLEDLTILPRWRNWISLIPYSADVVRASHIWRKHPVAGNCRRIIEFASCYIMVTWRLFDNGFSFRAEKLRFHGRRIRLPFFPSPTFCQHFSFDDSSIGLLNMCRKIQAKVSTLLNNLRKF